MIWIAASLAGSSVLGQANATPIEAQINRDQSVDLSWGEAAVNLTAPGPGCTTAVTWSGPAVQLEWVCGATLDSFGQVTTQSWTPGDDSPTPPLREDGVTWLTEAVQAHLDRGEWDDARGLAARFASRLQYAASDTERAELLLRFLLAHNGRAASAQAADRPRRAGLLANDFLSSPPIWEPERPWDYMQRLRIGPPAGNRPAPERAGYLPVGPESLAAVTALAQTLELGGEPRAAVEIAKNLIGVAPEHGPAHLVLADALWRMGSVEPARLAYKDAAALGFSPPRVTSRAK